jgi:hypothetical protein
MSLRKSILGTAALLGALALTASATAAPAPSVPAWKIQSIAAPTNFDPGDESGRDNYTTYIINSGGEPTNGDPITITERLPLGVKVEKFEFALSNAADASAACTADESGAAALVSCEVSEGLPGQAHPAIVRPGAQLFLKVSVKTPSTLSGALVDHVEVEGGNAAPVSAEATNEASPSDPAPGFEYFNTELTGPDGLPVHTADSHPYNYVTSFAANTVAAPEGARTAGGNLKEIEVALPPGLAANPRSIGRCTAQQFMTLNLQLENNCPSSSVVGLAAIQQLNGETGAALTGIFNLVPPKGMPAQLGFQVVNLPVYINTKVRSDSDYGVTAFLANVPEAQLVTATRITIWGTPWDASHDAIRGGCPEGVELCHVEGTPRPFMRLPSSCANPLTGSFSFETWAQPPASAAASFTEAAPSGCEAPPFAPTIEAKPSTDRADSPAGLHFDLHLPQKENEDPAGLGEADLRDTKVVLPAGLVVNPASADGLGACTPAQVGLTTPPGTTPAHFSLASAQCPDAAKLGTVEAIVPAVDHPLRGAAYLAAQEDNPFNSLLAFYIVLEDPQTGVVVKLAARVDPDPKTGQLTTTVQESPQVPVEDFTFDFFEGPRAPLRTPMSCATYTTNSQMTPWTAPQGGDAFPADSFEVTGGPQGPCPDNSLAPKLNAGFASPQAGAYSPFSLRLTREDATQEFAGLTTTPPLGLSARLAGIPYCPDSAIAQAKSREHPGGGQQELANPSCSSASEVGTVTAGAGAGPNPFYVGGKVYLAGPYKGAPISFLAVIPAVAGPFDLGTVVNRVAVNVDPETVQVKAVADPLPTILSGIPVDTRDLRVDLNRPNFTLAPTSCEPKTVGATVQGTPGQSATVTNPFQVGGCGALKFKPKVTLNLKGGTKRAKHPALKAVVTYPQGGAYANTAKASVALPHSEFLEQSHIRTICTRVQFAANACPKGAIYGKAKAFSPLLEQPVEGPIYLRSSSNPLPDMVLDLHGQIDAVAVARIDSHNGGIRSSFESVPDVPLSKVIVELQGGKKGLLVNSRNICKTTNRATAKFTAQSNKAFEERPLLKAQCKGKKGKGGKKK